MANNIKHVEELYSEKRYEDCHKYASKIFRKLKKMRKSGLEREGLYSNENLAFKMLRNAGLLDKLSTLKTNSYDKMMSLTISEEKSDFYKTWKNFIRG